MDGECKPRFSMVSQEPDTSTPTETETPSPTAPQNGEPTFESWIFSGQDWAVDLTAALNNEPALVTNPDENHYTPNTVCITPGSRSGLKGVPVDEPVA